MDIGMVGLGKMGGNMTLRLLRGGHRVVGFDLDPDSVARVVAEGADSASDMADLASKLPVPRVVWLMVPAGPIVDRVIDDLVPHLGSGDVVVDGGNSHYTDSLRRGDALADDGVHYVDVGTSGGVWGLAEGYSMMAGGAEEAVDILRPVLETLAPAPDQGWGRVGPGGSGHFVKMVHNGIEYGLMEAYAEGFSLMRAKEEFDVDLGEVAEIWRYGSVVRSWLLDLTARALEQGVDGIAPFVHDSGEGRWTVQESIDLAVPVPVIASALMRRFASRDDYGFSDRLVAAMRNQFGGHAVKSA